MLLVLLMAAAPAPAHTIGLGTKSCGEWIAAARENGWPSIAYRAWLGGFISGLNLDNAAKLGNLDDGTDFQGMSAWVDNYCSAHPLDRIDSAATALAIELLKRQPQQR